MEGRRFDEVRIELRRGIVSIPWSSCEALLDQFQMNRRWAITNSREQAALLLGYVKTIVERSPLLRAQLASARDDRLVFRGNRVLVAAPCQDRLIRGVSASALVFDEASHFVSESWGPSTLNGSGRPHGRCSRSTASRDGRSGSRRRATAKTSTGGCTSRPRPQRLLDDPESDDHRGLLDTQGEPIQGPVWPKRPGAMGRH